MVSFTSCSNEDDFKSVQKETSYLKSNLTFDEVTSIAGKVEQQIQRTTRSDGTITITENQAKTLLNPFIEDGKKIRFQIKEESKTAISLENALTKEELEFLDSLNDKELATLSLIALANSKNNTPNKQGDLTKEDILDCLGAAIGIAGSIKSLEITGLLTAKTGLAVLKAVASRYCLGYISLAICVYNFVDCIENVNNKVS